MQKKQINIDEIRIDGGTQMRTVVDQDWVYHIVERMKLDNVFPPVELVFDGVSYWLTDGFHRYHAYKILGIKKIDVLWESGALQYAREKALIANETHGKPLSIRDRRYKVETCLTWEEWYKKSNYEIAKRCHVSESFVAAVRDPEIAERQKENRERHYQNKLRQRMEDTSSTSNEVKLESIEPQDGSAPDEEELKIAELTMQANQEAMFKLLDSDDALKTAHAEIERLNHMIAQMEMRFVGLMNEKNEAIKMVKSLQKQLDKLKGKK